MLRPSPPDGSIGVRVSQPRSMRVSFGGRLARGGAAAALLATLAAAPVVATPGGYPATVNDPRAVALPLLAFVAVRSDEAGAEDRVAHALAEIPEVLEVHHVAGEDCYLVKVRARDAEDLGVLLRTRFGRIPGVRSTRTTIVLETVKETPRLHMGRVQELVP